MDEKAKKAPDIEREIIYLNDAQSAELDYGKGDDNEA